MLLNTKHFHAGLAYTCVETWLYGRCLQDQEDSPHQFCTVSLENGMCPRPWTTFHLRSSPTESWVKAARVRFKSPATGNPGNTWEFEGEIWQSQWCESMAWKIFFVLEWFLQNFLIQYWLKQPKKKHWLHFCWGNSYCVPCVSAWWQLEHLRTWFSWHRAMQMLERLWSSTVTRPNGGNREFLGEVFCILDILKSDGMAAWFMMIGSL